MILWGFWGLMACAARAPAEVGPPVQATRAFLLEGHGMTIGGAAVIAVGDEDWALLGLGPTGTALFTVRSQNGEVTTTAPDEGMASALAKMPLERDLWLLYRWTCAERCRVVNGVLTVAGDEVRWRGRRGPATIRRIDGKTILVDPRRGYRLTVLDP